MPNFYYEFAVKKARGSLEWWFGIITDAKNASEAFCRAREVSKKKNPKYDDTYGGVYAGPLVAEIKESVNGRTEKQT